MRLTKLRRAAWGCALLLPAAPLAANAGSFEHSDEIDGLGFGGGVHLGVEKFFADQFSVEGRVGFNASSVELEGSNNSGGTSSETRSISDFSSRLFVNFYW